MLGSLYYIDIYFSISIFLLSCNYVMYKNIFIVDIMPNDSLIMAVL